MISTFSERTRRTTRFPDERIIENMDCQTKEVLKAAPGSILCRLRFNFS